VQLPWHGSLEKAKEFQREKTFGLVDTLCQQWAFELDKIKDYIEHQEKLDTEQEEGRF